MKLWQDFKYNKLALGKIPLNLDGELVHRDGLACNESTLVLSISMVFLLVRHSPGGIRACLNERVRRMTTERTSVLRRY